MSCLLKIISILFFLCWMDITNCVPLFQGFSVNKGFEVNLKPFEFKPFSFFKEKWSPFGRFGVRRGISKRDLGDKPEFPVDPSLAVVPAPVFEQTEEQDTGEKRLETSVTPLNPGKSFSSNLILPPSSESLNPAIKGLYTNIGRDISPLNNYILQNTAEPLVPMEIYGELPPRPADPIPVQANFNTQPVGQEEVGFMPNQPGSPAQSLAPRPWSNSPIQTNFIPQLMNQEASFVPVQPASPGQSSGILQRDFVSLVTPPPANPGAGVNVPISEIPPTEGPFVRGSRVVLYFGNVLLELFSQFLTNARLQFSRPAPGPVPVQGQ